MDWRAVVFDFPSSRCPVRSPASMSPLQSIPTTNHVRRLTDEVKKHCEKQNFRWTRDQNAINQDYAFN